MHPLALVRFKSIKHLKMLFSVNHDNWINLRYAMLFIWMDINPYFQALPYIAVGKLLSLRYIWLVFLRIVEFKTSVCLLLISESSAHFELPRKVAVCCLLW